MPSRIIKESITTSETLAKLSGNEERHFWRLLVQADDYGYLDARPEVLRAKGYAMMLDTVSPKQSEAYTLALVKADLLHLFIADGKRYGHLPTWEKHQQVRAKRRKYPQVISCEISCKQVISHDFNSRQMITDVTVIQSESLSESLSESEAKAESSREKNGGLAFGNSTLLGLFSEEERAELGRVFPGVDLAYQAQKCTDWWAEKGKPMKRPRTSFRNWLEQAKVIASKNGAANGTTRLPDGRTEGLSEEVSPFAKYGHSFGS